MCQKVFPLLYQGYGTLVAMELVSMEALHLVLLEMKLGYGKRKQNAYFY